MAMAEKKRKINLLPNKGDTLFDQFLIWALSIGRLLVIITETLALSVFIYRFSLDVQIIDLHDKIETASTIVQNFKEGEDTYRNLQARLTLAKEYDSKKDRTLSLFEDIIALGQDRVTFRNLRVTVDTIEIEVQAFSPNTINTFIQGVKQHAEVKQVTIDRVQNSTSNGIVTVGITAELKTNLRQTALTRSDQGLSEEEDQKER